MLVRVDLNVPMDGARSADDTRLRATLPTVPSWPTSGAIVLLLSHFGRPKGQSRPDMSTAPLVRPLTELTGRSVRFIEDCQGPEAERAITTMLPGDHRHSREHALPCRRGKERSGAGRGDGRAWRLLRQRRLLGRAPRPRIDRGHHPFPAELCRPGNAGELKALEKALGNPERPVAAVVGGAKVSTKLAVLGHLVGKVDHLIIGGGMANTFLAARGVEVGKSLCEHELTGEAEAIFDAGRAAGCTIHLPYDVVVAKEFAPNPPSLRTCNVHEVAADEMILDVGPAAVEALADALKTCRTLVGTGRWARSKRRRSMRRRSRWRRPPRR